METAAAGLELLRQEVEDLPVSAVIVTHSHADHFGGLRGVVDEEDVRSGRVEFVAPDGFYEESVSENLTAGNTMSRRASYMYGSLLQRGPEGTVGSGLGSVPASGTVTLIEQNITVDQDIQTIDVDGIEMIFMNTPGAEAPAELMFYIPSFKALMQAEEINRTLHNLYTLRGAQVRNGLIWSKYIHQVIELFGDDVEISFGSHHWPTWGNEEIVQFWKNQRNVYRYIHDETLRLANHGYTPQEIAEIVELPETLASAWENRDYYGTVSHNVKAQYQLYFGWFDGNPANLHPLPPAEAGVKYVEYMGGSDAILNKALEDYKRGEYRWVAMALNHLVFAEPDNQEARALLANTYTQLGYQAESGPWRNFYLSGAMELRYGVRPRPTARSTSSDIVRNLPFDLQFDYLSVRLNGPAAADLNYTFNIRFPDIDEEVVLYLEDGVLNYTLDKQIPDATTSLVMDDAVLDSINLGETTFEQALAEGEILLTGDPEAFLEFLGNLDTFDFWFNIVTP